MDDEARKALIDEFEVKLNRLYETWNEVVRLTHSVPELLLDADLTMGGMVIVANMRSFEATILNLLGAGVLIEDVPRDTQGKPIFGEGSER